jgi:hypothetical protein
VIKIQIRLRDAELTYQEDTTESNYPKIISTDDFKGCTKSDRMLTVISALCAEVKILAAQEL